MTETPTGADLVIRAGVIHTLAGLPPQRAIAVRGDRIVASTADDGGLDLWITAQTRVIDVPDGAVLPSFDDTHTHLIYAGFGAHDVPVHRARNIAEFLELIRERAAITPPGEWIRTTTNWQELNLAERRMPTAAELDSATDKHAVLVRRGGHNAVANYYALNLAGVDADTATPPGGLIGRNDDGTLNGRLIDSAMHLVDHLLPRPSLEERISGLDRASRDYAASGIGTVRDCAVPLPDLEVLARAHEAGSLHTRVRALVMAGGMTDPKQLDELLDAMEPWRYRADPWLRVWGVKFVLDGGLEAGATEDPYVGHDDFCGLLMCEPDALVGAVEQVVRRGWRVGTHAYGDRAVRTLLDVYQQVLERNPGLPPRSLVIEHGGLATAEQRARAVALGIPVTIQQPLLHDTAEVEIGYWGQERVAQLFPARQWIDAGALVTGGSDFPVGPFGAMQSVWGMVTRETVAGVLGPEHAVTRDEAIEMHTVAAARLLGESDLRGSLVPGRLADLTIWPADPRTAPIEELRGLSPLATVIGGRVVYDAGLQ
ncbi:amidohydrolase [Nocardia sp. XZ_19_385]|uniref:amidohydrolase n=1 Tax=Nocardia sp. XZ_19_385 TaxID=2769488 RepID=UPI00188E9366|nr:amidohydrolase [Nocardia sp. XZ_19_385]